MGGDALAAMEHLDGAAGQAHVDLLADERVRHRVEEARGLDVIVEVDPGQAPFGDIRSPRPAAAGAPAARRSRTARAGSRRGGASDGR